VIVSEATPTVGIRVCVIFVNPRVLSWPHETIRAALAHELGHMFNNDFSTGRLDVPQIENERQADAVAATLLSRINLEACLALPRLLETFGPGVRLHHPEPLARAQETRGLCHQLAARSAR
jgi:Zn-dependent peptidase ImmA (M78 family)